MDGRQSFTFFSLVIVFFLFLYNTRVAWESVLYEDNRGSLAQSVGTRAMVFLDRENKSFCALVFNSV